MVTRAMRSLIPFNLDRFPYIGTLRKRVRAMGRFPAGHFYSPVPARADVLSRIDALPVGEVPGVALNTEQQGALLRAFERLYSELPFTEERRQELRYYFNQDYFCYADAIFLYSFLRHFQPRRILEVGSGFSSAVMLDTIDRFFVEAPEITLVEPYPDRLRTLLRSDDWPRVTLIEDKVQQVPLSRFDSLGAGDLLFIDSSHVLKCGSDLQFLMFDVLPRLRTGVFVHFHDVFDGFEYPREWLMDGVYWNEDYMLRAFLSYNPAWKITLFGSHAVRVYRSWLADHMPLTLKNPGGSLYLERAQQ
jgi:predicted O-methyltransferase YrrM